MILGYFSDFIKGKLDKREFKKDYFFPRNQLYQMYFVMARLDAAKFCKLDFIVNFGVSLKVKSELAELIANGGGKESAFAFMRGLDDLDLLKLHKYFFWADKKLHSVFFIEDKDQISEDLLVDFREGDEDF